MLFAQMKIHNGQVILVDKKEVNQEIFNVCPFTIFDPSHYREDGTCKCSNKIHRAFMIKNWDYSKKDFKDVPLVD